MPRWRTGAACGLVGLVASAVLGCAPLPSVPAEPAPSTASPATKPPTQEPLVTDEMLVGGVWQLQVLPGMPVLQTPLPSLEFLGLQQVQGSDGCNRFAAQVSVSGRSLRFRGLRATLMACMPQAPGQEDRFFLALERTRSVRLQNGQLDLLDESGILLAQFGR